MLRQRRGGTPEHHPCVPKTQVRRSSKSLCSDSRGHSTRPGDTPLLRGAVAEHSPGARCPCRDSHRHSQLSSSCICGVGW
eukprot:461408-Rhodomonas_salina.1